MGVGGVGGVGGVVSSQKTSPTTTRPKVKSVGCETQWANNNYTGKAAFAVDGNSNTKWTCKGMSKITFDLGKVKEIQQINISFSGSVSNGNYVKIYIDNKLVKEGIQPASLKTWSTGNTKGRYVTYETVAKTHNQYNQVAKWSEIGELSVTAR